MADFQAPLNAFLHTDDNGYWARRIKGELLYAQELAHASAIANAEPILLAVNDLQRARQDAGAITRQAVEAAEERLAPLAAAAKARHILCVGHAHIDMNWMWSWQETVAVTIETFRTMLDLLAEYPGFTFAQSQASVYQIIEKYAPELLDPIRAHVQEGRWELSASHWVEADKNMPNGESFVRHMLYTKAYLSDLFGIDPATLNIDFEPDTFGHSANMPELLTRGGVKYYYHCRGANDHDVYRWHAPSGASVLAYREPLWYNAEMTPEWAKVVPAYCQRHGLDTMLKVYGVGDHGGGPTRRDLEYLLDMQRWPIFPKLRFGTYREWFELLDASTTAWPDVYGERNCIFSGCYTTQTRIKRGNRLGEEALYRAEWSSTLAATLAGGRYDHELFTSAWRNVLFNQFHDIIPGSGVIDTREHAAALYQESQAVATARQSMALHALAERIDTSAWASEPATQADGLPGIGHGAGVGFGVKDGRLSQTGRGDGKQRVFIVFNPVFAERKIPTEIVVWDWHGDTTRLRVRDANGNDLPFDLLDRGKHHYWGHLYLRLLAEVTLPASGYTTVIVDEAIERYQPYAFRVGYDFRIEQPQAFILENDLVRAELRGEDLALTALLDKASGEQLVDAHRQQAGGLRLVLEDDSKGMTSWQVGRYMRVEAAFRTLHVTATSIGPGRMQQSIAFKGTTAERSRISGQIILRQGSRALEYQLEVDWHEVGRQGEGIPQLQYYLPAAYTCATYAYDVPCGIVRREPCQMDVPANAWMLAESADDQARALRLITDSKYGFRGCDDSLSVTLIRSSFDPDPYPEYGIHTIRLAVGIVAERTNVALASYSEQWRHAPIVVACKAGAGDLPPQATLLAIESGSALVMAVKQPEQDAGRAMIIRLAEYAGTACEVQLRTPLPVRGARVVDLHEAPADGEISFGGDRVTVQLPAYAVLTLRLDF